MGDRFPGCESGVAHQKHEACWGEASRWPGLVAQLNSLVDPKTWLICCNFLCALVCNTHVRASEGSFFRRLSLRVTSLLESLAPFRYISAIVRIFRFTLALASVTSSRALSFGISV